VGTAFTDESKRLFLGRFLLPEEIEPWIEAQLLGTLPAIYGVTHHTWSPTPATWRGRSTLDGVFRYYREDLGWPAGVGPHFFVAPRERGGPWGVWVATHPRHDGIHVSGWNSRSIGMEYVWNGDLSSFTPEMLRIGALVWQAIERKIGLPIRISYTRGSPGHFLHRDKSPKSCPGNWNDRAAIIDTYRASTQTQIPDFLEDLMAQLSNEEKDQLLADIHNTALATMEQTELQKRTVKSGQALSYRVNALLAGVLSLVDEEGELPEVVRAELAKATEAGFTVPGSA